MCNCKKYIAYDATRILFNFIAIHFLDVDLRVQVYFASVIPQVIPQEVYLYLGHNQLTGEILFFCTRLIFLCTFHIFITLFIVTWDLKFLILPLHILKL